MLDEEKEVLSGFESGAYIGVGVTGDGQRTAVPVPWEATAYAFNMNLPDVYLTPEDLADETLMKRLHTFHVTGFYAFAPLADYGFLATFPDLRDIFIAAGENVKDLSFLENLADWHMLHLEDAHLPDLEPIRRVLCSDRRFYPVCLSFDNCMVDSASALYDVKPIAELIVRGEDDIVERVMWRQVPALTFRYIVREKR